MPVTLYSSTGDLDFRPCRLIARPVPIHPDYIPPTSEPDEVIEPPSLPGARRRGNIRAGLVALLVFGILQTAALVPSLYLTHVFAG